MIINPYYADNVSYLLILVNSLLGWSPLAKKSHSENPDQLLREHLNTPYSPYFDKSYRMMATYQRIGEQ